MPKALMALLLAAAASFTPLSQARAEERLPLGYGRLFTNDQFVGSKDRWRTGSHVVSRVTGPAWDGALPDRFGAIREYRLRGEIIAPASLTAPAANDRRYVGALSFGLHSHFALGGAEASIGVDLVATGPRTGLSRLQRRVHKVMGMKPPTASANQIGNRLHPTITAELGQTVALTPALSLRPFVEAQAGVETFARIGGDITLGSFGQGALMLRDVTTGQRYRGVDGQPAPGLSLVLGGDVAHVARSAYLPSGGAAQMRNNRSRLRAGVHWQGERASVFYGVTRLGREFEQQPEPQTVGSLRVQFRF